MTKGGSVIRNIRQTKLLILTVPRHALGCSTDTYEPNGCRLAAASLWRHLMKKQLESSARFGASIRACSAIMAISVLVWGADPPVSTGPTPTSQSAPAATPAPPP